MANVFVDLPLPVMNGPGAAVDVSSMGNPKTIAVVGDFAGATITVEASTDGGVVFAPVPGGVFGTGDRKITIGCAAQFMRVNVSGRKTSVPFAANIDVGGNDGGSLFAVITLPALNGPGPAINVSAFGSDMTFIAGGVFAGARILAEVSEDGVDWAPVLQFAGQGGLQNEIITGQFVRANVSGRKTTVPFTGSLSLGAANDPIAVAGGITNLSEQWAVNDVPANQTNIAMEAQVSTNFATWKAIRAGSLVGMTTRLTEAITAGQLDVEVTVNGVGTGFVITHTSVLNALGGIATQADGIDTYVAGDLIGFRFTTTVGFLPISTDLEAYADVKTT